MALHIGNVFILWCRGCLNPKYKFHVLAVAGDRPRYFVVNSAIAAFQRQNQTLLEHQAPLAAGDHRWLKHDSYLDCSSLIGGYTASELEDALAAEPRTLVGTIATAARRNVRRIVGSSELLSPAEVQQLLGGW